MLEKEYIGEDDLLIIFTKNQEYGRVKTRLAKTIGHDNAMKVFRRLLEHTRDITLKINCYRMVSYSDYIDYRDLFDNYDFIKDDQIEGDLGERLSMVFKESFDEGYNKIICIGSDCIELTHEEIAQAIVALDTVDVVLGPAKDGGYYLIGMKKLNTSLFENKPWSTSDVLLDTILELKKQQLSYSLLKVLSDVDRMEDLNDELKKLVGF